jgi:DNA-binding HxlR family transcriptional regulator
MEIQDLLRYRACIPILLTLLDRGKAYKREFELINRISNESVNQGLKVLLKERLISRRKAKNHPYAEDFYYLTSKGRKIAEAFAQCNQLLQEAFVRESEEQPDEQI